MPPNSARESIGCSFKGCAVYSRASFGEKSWKFLTIIGNYYTFAYAV